MTEQFYSEGPLQLLSLLGRNFLSILKSREFFDHQYRELPSDKMTLRQSPELF